MICSKLNINKLHAIGPSVNWTTSIAAEHWGLTDGTSKKKKKHS